MKAKVKRVQSNEFDFSTLGSYERTVYVNGLVGSLISTISTQTLVEPRDIVRIILVYAETFDPETYLSTVKYCRQYVQGILEGINPPDKYKDIESI